MTISQKVLWPTVLGIVTGFGLLVAGLIAKDAELRTAGLAAISTALLSGGVGYSVPHTPSTGHRGRDRAR